MITLRQSPFDLFDRLEQQVAQAERVPAAEVLEDANGYTVRLELPGVCLLYTSPSPRDKRQSRMPSSA